LQREIGELKVKLESDAVAHQRELISQEKRIKELKASLTS